MTNQKPPKQYKVTTTEWWQMYKNNEFIPGEYVTADHLLLAKKKVDGEPVWAEYRN